MARTAFQTHIIKPQQESFADWFAELCELAGDRWPEVSDQAPTCFAIWVGAMSAYGERDPTGEGCGLNQMKGGAMCAAQSYSKRGHDELHFVDGRWVQPQLGRLVS